MALTLKQIADVLGISRSRVDQWISRRYFTTPDTPRLGMSREWDASDALRLAVMNALLHRGVPANIAGDAVSANLPLYETERSFLALWAGYIKTATAGVRTYNPDHTHVAFLRESEVAEFVLDQNVRSVLLLDVDAIANQVTESLQRLDNFKKSVERAGATFDEGE